MSPRNGKLVQYGRRSSTKHQNPDSTAVEPLQKRRKLMEDDQHSLRHMDTAHTDTSDTVKMDRVKPILTTPQKSTSDSPHRAPSRIYSSKSKTSNDSPLIAADTTACIFTRPNTPRRSTSPVSNVAVTPPPKPKDLSGVFAPLPQFTPHSFPSPGKSITKRMLVRSRTAPFSASPSSPQSSPRSALTATLSLPSVVSASPLQPKLRPPSPPSPSPALSKPHLRTYSQSRSFLVALPASVASQELSSASSKLSVTDNTVLEPDDGIRESYTDLRTRWGVDHLEDDPYHVPGVTNELMSITELRSKGESRRFLDEVGYLFEGLEEPGMAPSVQRSSATEIVLKMCDPEFMRKAKAADFISHAWDAMRHVGKSSDTALDPYLAFFVALVARDTREVDDLSRKDGFFDVILRLLQIRKENDGLVSTVDAYTPNAGFTKTERIALLNLRKVIVNKSDLSVSSFPSIRLLASYALSRVPVSRYPSQTLPTVLQSLMTELALLRPRIDSYTSGRALLPTMTSDIPDLEHLDHCLRIIDSFLLGSWSLPLDPEHLDAERESLSTGLIAHCVMLSLLNAETKQSHSAQYLESTFRVLINVSRLGVQWCKHLVADPLFLPVLVREILSQCDWAVKEEIVEVEEVTVRRDSLDRQCLALALLSNVLLAVDETKILLRDIVINPSCPGGRLCALSCRCSKRLNAIECFVTFFVDTNPKSDSLCIPELDFFRCHLAALLCLLTFEDPINQDMVRRTLPGVNVQDKIRGIYNSIQLFLEFYTETRKDVDPGMGDTGMTHMPSRVASALEALCT